MFIDEWLAAGFYKKLDGDFRFRHSFGQIFWTHTYYPHENLELWRPVIDPNEPTKSSASSFRIVAAGADAFNRGFPLITPSLKTKEEFVVLRAKRRPVMLIQSAAPIAGTDNRGYRGKFARSLCVVSQVFGIADTQTGTTKFAPCLIDRVRRLEYPQIMFLPQLPGVFPVDGMLRLDHLQSVFVPHLEATAYCLCDEGQTILKAQLQYLVTGEGPNYYTALREQLMND